MRLTPCRTAVSGFISSYWSSCTWTRPAACCNDCGASSFVAAAAVVVVAGCPSSRSTLGSSTRTRIPPPTNRCRPRSRLRGTRTRTRWPLLRPRRPRAAGCTWCTFSVCTRCSARTRTYPAPRPPPCSVVLGSAGPRLEDLQQLPVGPRWSGSPWSESPWSRSPWSWSPWFGSPSRTCHRCLRPRSRAALRPHAGHPIGIGSPTLRLRCGNGPRNIWAPYDRRCTGYGPLLRNRTLSMCWRKRPKTDALKWSRQRDSHYARTQLVWSKQQCTWDTCSDTDIDYDQYVFAHRYGRRRDCNRLPLSVFYAFMYFFRVSFKLTCIHRNNIHYWFVFYINYECNELIILL